MEFVNINSETKNELDKLDLARVQCALTKQISALKIENPYRAELEQLKDFLRIPRQQDLEEKKRIRTEYADIIKDTVKDNQPLWFHGVSSISKVEKILQSGHLGYLETEESVSFTSPGTLDVVTKDALDISLDSFTGLSTSGREKFLPAGCLFAIAPKDKEELEQLKRNVGSEDNIETVDFRKAPDRIVAIISTTENKKYLSDLASKNGIDVSKVCGFDEFAERLNDNKIRISLEEQRSQPLTEPNNHTQANGVADQDKDKTGHIQDISTAVIRKKFLEATKGNI